MLEMLLLLVGEGPHYSILQTFIYIAIFNQPASACIYSRLSLSRPRLSRITAYLEEKLWSLFSHGNLIIGNKILRKREIGPKEQFLLFSTIFSLLYLTSGFKLHIHLLNVVVRFIVFLNSANLICRGTDISKYFRESLGLRNNKNRLYMNAGWCCSSYYSIIYH